MSGRKATNLQRLQAEGLPVPDFYVISADRLGRLSDPEVVEELVADLRVWRSQRDIESIAVRSSADSEDGSEHSFAGQYASVMPVRTDEEFVGALETVAGGRPHDGYSSAEESRVHALVQNYVKPDLAGVLFTVNPANGRLEFVINSVRGHGRPAVEGGPVSTAYVSRPGSRTWSPDDSPGLAREQLAQLSRAAEKIEAIMDAPQDIEWAFAGQQLYVLQTRPITRIAHLQVWDRSNVSESFPGLVRPLTYSVSRRGYELVYQSQAHAAGLSWRQLAARRRTFRTMVGLFAGRVYYNLGSWYQFIGFFPGNSRHQRYLDAQLQTAGEAAYLPPSQHSWSFRLRFYLRVARRAILFERERAQYWRYLDGAYQDYERLPPGSDPFLLLARYTHIEQQVMPQMGRSADNDYFVMICHGLLQNCLGRWMAPDDRRPADQATDFLGALHDVVSARQALLLNDIAAGIKADPTAASLLAARDYAALEDHLQGSGSARLLAEYRERFLHRFAEDQKLESRNPLLTPAGFYRLVATYTQLDNEAVKDRQSRALADEAERQRRLARQLGWHRRLLYRLLVRRLKHHLRIREHNRLLRGQAFAYLRSLFADLGQSLADLRLLERSDDIYYLDIEEILRLVDGTGYHDSLQAIADNRRRAYKNYESQSVPDRFVTVGLTDQVPEDFLGASGDAFQPAESLTGVVSSPGNVSGRAAVLHEPVVPDEPFDILVVAHTDPGWTPLIALARGVVVEHGGLLSHAAIVTRELGIPSIIGVAGAVGSIRTGDTVRLDAAKGAVEIL